MVNLFLVGGTARGNLILNGSFESGGGTIENPNPGANYYSLAANSSTDLTDWTVGADPLAHYFHDDAPNAEDGSRWMDFASPVPTSEPYGAYSINQSFSVLAGATYTVTYYEKERLETGNKLIADILFAAGSGTGTLSQTAQNESLPLWHQFTFSFKPNTDTTATLRFSGGGTLNAGSASQFYGTALDNIDVEQTGVCPRAGLPQPASLSAHCSRSAAAAVNLCRRSFSRNSLHRHVTRRWVSFCSGFCLHKSLPSGGAVGRLCQLRFHPSIQF